MPFKLSFEALGDILIESRERDPNKHQMFKLESVTEKPLKTVLRNVGYKLGHFSLDSLQMPDGIKLVLFEAVGLIVEELGWVEETNGTPYFSFSGGIEINLGKRKQPAGDADESSKKGFAVGVERLRFRLNHDHSQPLFKIDGITLSIHAGKVTIDGFGYIGEFDDGDWAIKEWGFGIALKIELTAYVFGLAAEFIRAAAATASRVMRSTTFSRILSWTIFPRDPMRSATCACCSGRTWRPASPGRIPTVRGWRCSSGTRITGTRSRCRATGISTPGSPRSPRSRSARGFAFR